MRLFRALGSKLHEANEALATAQKAWQDERLSNRARLLDEREQAIRKREEQVTVQLIELDGRRWATRVGYVLVAALAGIPSYYVGTLDANSHVNQPSQPAPVVASPAAAKPLPVKSPTKAPQKEAPVEPRDRPGPRVQPHHPNPDVAAQQGLYGNGREFNVGFYCLDKEEVGEMTFEGCLNKAARALSGTP